MMSRSAAPSIEVTRPMRRGSAGSGRLRACVEQALGGELLLQLFEGLLQGAEAFRLHVLAEDLVLALGIVDADLAARDDLQAVFRLELQVAQRRPEHHRLDLRCAVLQREVQVPGVPDTRVRNLALDPHVLQLVFEQVPDRGVQFADASGPCESEHGCSGSGVFGNSWHSCTSGTLRNLCNLGTVAWVVSSSKGRRLMIAPPR